MTVWQRQEEAALVRAVRKHGTRWKRVKADTDFNDYLGSRTTSSMKSRWFKIGYLYEETLMNTPLKKMEYEVSQRLEKRRVKRRLEVLIAEEKERDSMLSMPSKVSPQKHQDSNDISKRHKSSQDLSSVSSPLSLVSSPQNSVVSSTINDETNTTNSLALQKAIVKPLRKQMPQTLCNIPQRTPNRSIPLSPLTHIFSSSSSKSHSHPVTRFIDMVPHGNDFNAFERHLLNGGDTQECLDPEIAAMSVENVRKNLREVEATLRVIEKQRERVADAMRRHGTKFTRQSHVREMQRHHDTADAMLRKMKAQLQLRQHLHRKHAEQAYQAYLNDNQSKLPQIMETPNSDTSSTSSTLLSTSASKILSTPRRPNVELRESHLQFRSQSIVNQASIFNKLPSDVDGADLLAARE